MSSDIHVCRFCGKSAHRDWLVKYGTRHYAHFECFPIERVNKLPDWEKRRFDEWLQEDCSL